MPCVLAPEGLEGELHGSLTMNELVREFEHFTRTQYRSNPQGESETTSFIRHLAKEKALLEFGPADWMELVDHLGLPEDKVGELMEGAASWIAEEPVPPSEQEPADWPTESPKIHAQENPMLRYGKGTEIEDCVCEESCDCDPCPCDECEECTFCLCCCCCSDEEEDDSSDEKEPLEDQDAGEEE